MQTQTLLKENQEHLSQDNKRLKMEEQEWLEQKKQCELELKNLTAGHNNAVSIEQYKELEATLKSERDSWSAEQNELKTRIDHAEIEHEKLKTQYEYELELETLRAAANSDLDSSVSKEKYHELEVTLKSETEALNMELSELKASLAQAEHDYITQKNLTEELQMNLNKSGSELQVALCKLSSCENKNLQTETKQNDMISELENKLKVNMENISRVDTINRSLNQELTSEKELNENLKQEIQRLESRHTVTENSESDSNSKIKKLQSELSKQTSKIEKLGKKNSELSQKIKDLQKARSETETKLTAATAVNGGNGHAIDDEPLRDANGNGDTIDITETLKENK